jgi:hypothetical protein
MVRVEYIAFRQGRRRPPPIARRVFTKFGARKAVWEQRRAWVGEKSLLSIKPKIHVEFLVVAPGKILIGSPN